MKSDQREQRRAVSDGFAQTQIEAGRTQVLDHRVNNECFDAGVRAFNFYRERLGRTRLTPSFDEQARRGEFFDDFKIGVQDGARRGLRLFAFGASVRVTNMRTGVPLSCSNASALLYDKRQAQRIGANALSSWAEATTCGLPRIG